jgi:hypothetical protein
LSKITAKTVHKQIMTLEDRKRAFVRLGEFLSQFREHGSAAKTSVLLNDTFFQSFTDLIELSRSHNGWYTPEHVHFAINSWAEALTEKNLNQWLSAYDFSEINPKTVALILAGNIPLVGFHDFLSVVISGHRTLVKTSSNDQHLLPFLANYLIAVEPRLEDQITFTKGQLTEFDAVIATGSNNTSRYFEYYFRDKPSIIRKNRNSVAVLTGDETNDQLVALGEDIFRYFGLGCRNVSKLFVPRSYNFDLLFNALYEFRDVLKYEKYTNNYDYNKAVFLMSNYKLLDNGFITLKEDSSYASPISSIFYEYYDDLPTVISTLEKDSDKIQCVVSTKIPGAIEFGKTQKPQLWDYADNVDTLAFLAAL